LKAERAWFLSAGEESEAGNRAGFDSLGQNQRVLEILSLIFCSLRERRILLEWDVRKMAEKEDTLLEIVTIGNPVLTQKSEIITHIDQEICNLASRMVKTMHAAPGIGLAAPQVNRGIQLITVDLSVGENSQDLIILANPEILNQEGEAILEEGCLSVPGVNEKITRPYRVTVRGIDLDGKERIIEAQDLLARVFCHEIDHINGKLIIDRLSPLKKSLIRKKLQKQREID